MLARHCSRRAAGAQAQLRDCQLVALPTVVCRWVDAAKRDAHPDARVAFGLNASERHTYKPHMTKLGSCFLVLALAACGGKQPAPATLANTAPANTAPAGASWDAQVSDFLIKVADVADASGGDCDKVATGLEALEAQAKSTHDAMVAANHTMKDYQPTDAVGEHMKKVPPTLFDRCEKENPRANKALDQTLLVVVPLEDFLRADPGDAAAK